MQTKTITVKEITLGNEWYDERNKRTIHYFNMKCITDDGEELEGQFGTTNNPQTKFLIDNSYEVDITEREYNGVIQYKFDYSEAQGKKSKGTRASNNANKAAGYKYVRPRSEIMSIISQSSYEAAMILCTKISNNKDVESIKDIKITNHDQIASISEKLCKYIVDKSGLNSVECKNTVPLALKEANNTSIVLQKSLKIAIMGLELEGLTLPEGQLLLSTQGIVTLTELITDDINKIANGL